MKESEAIEWIKELRDSEEIREFYYAENFIKACDRAIQALEKQASKTSCDVDKIVEQLQRECDYSYTGFEDYAKTHLNADDEYHYLELQRAIEIVKAGGKNGIEKTYRSDNELIGNQRYKEITERDIKYL